MKDLPQWLPEDFNSTQSVEFRRPLYMFIIKVASLCNLDCAYCYVYQSPDKSWQWKPKFLESGVLENIALRIQQHVAEHHLNSVSIVFHGGEPLLAGVERLKSYVRVLSSVIKCQIEYAMQTNGILIDAPLIEFLSEHKIRIGISIDGDRKNNDRHRLYHNQKSSYDDTVNAIRLLQSSPNHKSIFGGVLMVIDVRNKPEDILDELKKLGIGGANLLLPDANYESQPYRPENSDLAYGKWLADFFTLWFENYSQIEIPYFEEIINLMLGGVSSSEEIGAQSVDFIVVDTNGDIEAVDTLKKVGRKATSLNLNVASNSFDDALNHPAIYSRMSGFNSLCRTCQDCKFLNNCGGGYIPHRYSAENGFLNPSVYCNDLQYLFDRIHSHVFPIPIPHVQSN